MRRSAGFTLLELLVAVGVFGVMAALAWRGLVAVAVSDETLDEEARALARLQFAVGLIERDLRQAVPRGVRDGLGQALPAVLGTRLELSLTRAGWGNPTGQRRSTLERVDYRYDGETLRRLSWPVLDRTQGSAPIILDLLDDIEQIDIAYLDPEGDWTTRWPPAARLTPAEGEAVGAEAWPRAVTLVLRSTRWGRIERSFNLVDAPRPPRGLAETPPEDSDGTP